MPQGPQFAIYGISRQPVPNALVLAAAGDFRRAGHLPCCCYARRPCCRRRDMGVLRASVAKTSLSTPVDGVIAGSK